MPALPDTYLPPPDPPISHTQQQSQNQAHTPSIPPNPEMPSSPSSHLTTLLGPSCAQTPFSPDCSLLLISKLTGLSILLIGSLLKLPSLYPIVRSKSTRGIPIQPILLEVFGFTIGIAYNIRQRNSFTTWGEALMLLAADLAILAIHWEKRPIFLAFFGLLYALACRILLTSASNSSMQTLLGLTVPAFMTGTVLQIIENYRNKHIGAISPATLTMGLFCGLGRMLTTFVEVDDPVVRASAVMGAALGVVMWVQMIMYKEGTARFLDQGKKK